MSNSGTETLYHSSPLWPWVAGGILSVALGAALGARIISPSMAAPWALPRELGGGAALEDTAGAALYAPLYAVGVVRAGAAAGAVLDAPLYVVAGTTTGATAGSVRGAAGLGA